MPCLRQFTASALLLACVAAASPLHAAAGAEGARRTLAVLDVELLDEQGNPAAKPAQAIRLRDATAQLRRELAEHDLYTVSDPLPARELVEQLRATHEFLYRCDDCAVQVGERLGVDLVMTPWVQKVSELILNFNVQLVDVKAGKAIFTKSVDMRGNQDESWTRAVRYLVRDMAEKRALDPRYAR
ncbi:MAG TPA: DUF3280 domain-containing protein [Usitatibacter sp.]|nr:DUF3280 domain-containing protein [Usitatibacter sp.]